MIASNDQILNRQQLADYEEFGFIQSIPILSAAEVAHYRTEAERSCRAIGDSVTRLDALHFFFRWAWDLSTHPRLLDCLEQILGPNILLKSTRLFYKHSRSDSYVGWHQDGITENLVDGRAPAIWLGLTAATVENGCLRVLPGSHHLGLFAHVTRPPVDALSKNDNLAYPRLRSRTREAELSGKITSIPAAAQSPIDLVMRAGEMSIHHPVMLHGSNPNRSDQPRIGLSASYSAPELFRGARAVWARGSEPRNKYDFECIDRPPTIRFADAVAAYRESDFQILFAQT